METPLPDIRGLSKEELAGWFAERGEPSFRLKQVNEWLWERHATAFGDMTNLGKELRATLAAHFCIGQVSIATEQRSRDGSIKYGFRLADGELVEGVLIPTASRVTACVSSQSGCSLSCKFCATGYMPLKRNLHAYEIFDQVATLRTRALAEYGRPLTNIVYMGMGEPLLNYRNVMESIQRVTSAEEGLGMSARRITLSTAGIAKMIRKLGDDGFRCEFALSLHAATDAKRSLIMPINESNSLEALTDALLHFYDRTGTRITLEYIVLQDLNDGPEDAEALLQFSRVVPSKINIIEYNPIAEAGFVNTGAPRMEAFRTHLERGGAIVNVRRSRGRDVDGACGQLAIKER
ncbi:MAG: 23S rRNA (adenine(2503)-C(2))-methyltransferase RlmN [Bacteroidetes bacterium]|nr:23S rRNA (adenine(2503)-C(2))-methyltransferase RlmN [Bacteroidota bacterium]